MPKGYKIKRYRKIYRGGGHSPFQQFFKWGAAAVAVLVLLFVGWNIYGPLMDFLSGNLEASLTQEQSQPSSSDASSPEVSEPAQSQPQETANPVVEEVRAIYLPNAIINNTAELDRVLEELSQSTINAIVFDVKDSSGNVLYQSDLPLVEQAASQVENSFDLAALCEKLRGKNLTPIAWLSAYRDPIAASRIPDAGIKYAGTEMLWLDNSADAGGKPWLNPYSELAQAYITDIASECVSLGVERIMLDNVSFPTGYSQEYANYGSSAAQITRSDILAQFIDSIDEELSSMGAQVSLYISGPAAVGASNTYYGSNPLTLSNNHITLGVMPAQFGDGFTYENFSLEAPILSPGNTVDTLLKFLAPDVAGKKITAMLQAYPASYLYENNKMYTAEDINAQITACAANGVKSYIIYSPDGTYPT